MVRPRAENYEERRQEIVDAAAAMWAVQGFDGSSISSIAQRCGVSKALFYHYFQSKEALLYYMLQSHCQLLAETANAAISADDDPKTQLNSLVRQLMQLYMHSRDKHIVLLNNLHSLPQEQQKEIKDLERGVVGSIKNIVAKLRPELNDPMRTSMAMYLMGAINWTYTWFNPSGAVSAKKFADLATSVFLDGVRGELAHNV